MGAEQSSSREHFGKKKGSGKKGHKGSGTHKGSKHKHKSHGEKYLSVRTPRPRRRSFYDRPYYGYGYGYGNPYMSAYNPYRVVEVVDPSYIYNPIPLIGTPYGNPSIPGPYGNPSIPFPPDGISGSFSNMYGGPVGTSVGPVGASVGLTPDYSTSCGGNECNYYPGLNNSGFQGRCTCCNKGKKCRNPKRGPLGVKYQDCCKGLKCKTVFPSDTYGHCQ